MCVRLAVVVLVAAFAVDAHAQAPADTLAGIVVDAATGAPLVGATVAWPGLARGTATGAQGRFRLAVPPGADSVAVSFVGYAAQRVAARSSPVRVALVPGAALGEVRVDADAQGPPARPETSVAMGHAALSGRDVQRLPSLLGEADVLKAVQLLPGVRGGAEASAGLFVRGGSADQTLITLDGVPIYNPSHLFGFLSTFHPDAVDAVELTRGAYPARYGGRLGAVVDVRLREGDLERPHVQANVGLLAARVLAEGPLVPGRVSLLVAARRSYIDLLVQPFVARSNANAAKRGDAQIRPSVGFYDLTARLHARPSARDRLDLTLYGGADAFGFTSADPVEACGGGMCVPTGATDLYGGALDWGNRLGALAWARRWSDAARSTLTLSASDYAFDVRVDVEEDQNGAAPTEARARYRSGIRDLAARLDVDLAPHPAHTVRVGLGTTTHRFTPGALALVGANAQRATAALDGEASDSLLAVNRSVGLDLVAYAEDEWRIGRALTVSAGVHGAFYASGRFRYPSVEPRLSAALRLHERLALKASVATTQQPIHLLTTGAGIGLPADLWVPADSIGPQRGQQAAVGLAGSLGRTTWTVEAYARRMRGLVAYRDGASFSTPFTDWQQLVVTGDGTARGLEVFVQHRADRLTAWLSYTLARSDRRFAALDGGAAFPYRYDRRHSVSAVALARAASWLDVSATFAYGTGDAVTLPAAVYDATPLASGDVGAWVASYPEAVSETAYAARNGYRLPAYVRLDLGATVFFRRGGPDGRGPHSLSLTVYNATNHKNPFVTTLDSRVDAQTGETRQQLVGISLFPVLPAVSYQIGF